VVVKSQVVYLAQDSVYYLGLVALSVNDIGELIYLEMCDSLGSSSASKGCRVDD
jgi:hypothetical protein